MTIDTTKPFTDLGWHITPLQGELKRLPDGKKTTPGYQKDWLAKAIKTKELEPYALGGAITGKESGIIAIDCDNTITYSMFKALDPNYKFHFISLGKKDKDGVEQVCGTIVYEYTDQLADSFKITSNSMALDFLSANRMTYLPTKANKTKVPMDIIPKLTPPPPEIIALLQGLKTAKETKPVLPSAISRHKFNLQPQVEAFVRSGTVTKSLFRILTPYEYRNKPEYIANGYLHPNDLGDSEGSDWLVKVSAILGADSSIDSDLYIKAIRAINDTWTDPMTITRLMKEIIVPMCEGHSKGPDGTVIWCEDPDWSANVLTFFTKFGTVIHTFYDYYRKIYYVVDLAEEHVQTFGPVQQLMQHIDSIAIESMKAAELKAAIPTVLSDSEPEKLFGFYANDKERFNTFISSESYKIFKNPLEYMEYAKHPEITLKFLETLVPEEKMRTFLLGFLRRKLDTFDYSPIILYFLGVAGSGKDTFVNMIENIVGQSSITRPTAKMFLEKNNAWIFDKLFVQLDEFGDQLTTYSEKSDALGRLKLLTGKSRVSIRAMREDLCSYDHKMTFIMTSNHNPLILDDDERRIALFNCPNALNKVSWIYQLGGVGVMMDKMAAELNDFCYYLATKINSLNDDDYRTPPSSHNKEELIANSMPVARRLSYYLQTENWKAFKQVAINYGPLTILDRCKDNKILEDDLIELYSELRGGTDDLRSAISTVRIAMKDAGFSSSRTCLTGNRHAMVYTVPGLYKIPNTVLGIENEDV